MSVDGVTRADRVNPQQDSNGQQRRQEHEHERKKPSRDEPAQPTKNAYGEVIGQHIDITV